MRSVWGLVTAGDFASDNRWPELPFSQVVGGVNFLHFQKSKQMIPLFFQTAPHLFLQIGRPWQGQQLLHLSHQFDSAAGLLRWCQRLAL